jgi:hypothetical protein
MKINYGGISLFLVISVLLVMLMLMILSTGCVTAAKNVGREIMKTPTPTPVPVTVPTTAPPTPRPTPEAVKTIAPYPVDPFVPGQRWEGQWFQWWRKDVQGINSEGKKDLNVGVIVYRHAFLDYYTWYNAEMGNYQVQKPSKGNRYFAVWIHEEMIGNTTEFDPSMWIFDQDSFYLQVYDQIIPYNPEVHNPVLRILEFDRMYDYYDTVTAGPFGYRVQYQRSESDSAGYMAIPQGWLRMGEGNAADGYLIYEIPERTMEEDLQLIGTFATFGQASWRFV